MCLGVPGKVISVGEDLHQLATVDVCGVSLRVNIALVCEDSPQALIGQWVLVHVGFAMSLLDEQEALEMLAALEQLRAVGLERPMPEGKDALH
ncbi:hydrogenase 2 accessory protein HypG [Chania multitudinisentens RB-25]|uniref:Hydrogenase 2 accessory protein HypG n=1 Tax=Chania multitudinisentens RB-25 TaxID=1441930 RepID=W0L424_9GAMM|nr:hydrogenase maturation factor HybG [Chania multitudinisentens]AHG18508.1 hydrogenase 2 accessory protein HypG [Chania multitudinisentens RB-25]